MGIIKRKKVIAWEHNHEVICFDCGDPDNDEPLTAEDFKKDDVIFCLNCGKQIL